MAFVLIDTANTPTFWAVGAWEGGQHEHAMSLAARRSQSESA